MKILFTVMLVINFLVEALAAASLIGGPEGMSVARSVGGDLWSMNYGFAALAIASSVLWIWPYRDSRAAVTAVLGILTTFHIGVFISLAVPMHQVVGVGIHAFMSLFCLFLFTQRSKWCSNP